MFKCVFKSCIKLSKFSFPNSEFPWEFGDKYISQMPKWIAFKVHKHIFNPRALSKFFSFFLEKLFFRGKHFSSKLDYLYHSDLPNLVYLKTLGSMIGAYFNIILVMSTSMLHVSASKLITLEVI
jgi:hypothetical protein